MRLDMAEREQWSIEQAQLALDCIVYVDGKEVKYCVVADEEKGYVEFYKQDANGKFIREGDEIACERLDGYVEIKGEARRTKRG